MIKASWLMVLLAAGTVNAESAAEERWISAGELKNPPYVIEQTGERALLYKSGDRAGAAIVVFRESYRPLLAALRKRVESVDGIEREDEIPKSGFLNMFGQAAMGLESDEGRTLWLHSWKADTGRMKKAGFMTEDFAEIRIQSKPFNRLQRRDASSVASFHVLNAAELFGMPGTIMIAYRHDSAKEWGWHNAHDPFSFGYKVRVERQFTSSEQDLIDSVSRMVESPYTVIPMGSGPFPSYVDAWERARTWLAKQQDMTIRTK